MIRQLLRQYREAKARRKSLVRLIDFKGNPVMVPRDLIMEAAHAEILDQAALLNEDRLVWQHNPVFRFDTAGLRYVIEVAKHYENPDLAILAIAAHVEWPDEDE